MQVVCLDDPVPADDQLRRIEALVDWAQVRRTAEPFYRPGGAGRPRIESGGAGQARAGAGWRGLPSMRVRGDLPAVHQVRPMPGLVAQLGVRVGARHRRRVGRRALGDGRRHVSRSSWRRASAA